MKMTYYSVLALSAALALILVMFQEQFLHMMSGEVEQEVFISAKTYFLMSIFSYPLFSVYI
jgi:Na+-driven multidrug efflux pump